VLDSVFLPFAFLTSSGGSNLYDKTLESSAEHWGRGAKEEISHIERNTDLYSAQLAFLKSHNSANRDYTSYDVAEPTVEQAD
jgi:hypothetical protein